MNQDRYSISDVEEILQGGAFRPSEDLQIKVRAKLMEATVPSPTRRLSLAASLTIVAAFVLTGIVIAFSFKEKAANVLNGVGAVYSAGLVHEVNEIRQVDDISVILDWVYADWNQILVGYTVQDHADRNEEVEVEAYIVSAMLSDRTVLKGGPLTGYAEMGIESVVAAYDTPENVRGLNVIALELVLRVEQFQYQVPSGIPEERSASQVAPMPNQGFAGGEVSIELSIPVTPGRVIEVGQTVEAAGYQLALERVILAPSMTTARLCFQVPDPVKFHNWMPFITLTTGTQRFRGSGSGYQVGETYSCQRIEIRDSVPLDHDRYVFRVDELAGFEFNPGDIITTDMLPEEQWRIKGPWVFTLDSQP